MAATDLERLVVQLSADLKKYENSMRKVSGQTNRTARGVERRWDRMFSQMQNRSSAFGRNFRRLFATAVAGVAVRAAIQTADAWTQAENALKSVEASTGRTAASMDDLVRVAVDTRTSFEATATLYTRLERAGAQLGVSQEEVLRVTELVNKAFVAGGASAAEQRSAILQLSQAMASGQLQGEELRAIRENAPLVAQAIADAMGVGIGALRDLGAEGRITGDVFVGAMLNAGRNIEAQVDATSMTVGQAMNNLRTSVLQVVGGMDDASGATSTLAESIDQLATTIRENRTELAELASWLVDVGNFAVGAAAALGGVVERVRRLARGDQFQPVGLEQTQEELARVLEMVTLYERRVADGRRSPIMLSDVRTMVNPHDLATIEALEGGFRGLSAQERILMALRTRANELVRALRQVEQASADAGTGEGDGSGVTPRPITTPVSAEHLRAREQIEANLELSLAQLRNDQARAQEMQDQLDLIQRIASYEQAGYETAEARTRAEADQARLVEARGEAQQREIALMREAVDLEVAQSREDGRTVRALERQADTRERIVAYQEQGLALEKATALAAMDVKRIEEARAEVRRRELADAEMSHRITLAELSGQTEIQRSLEAQAEIERRRREYRDDMGLSDEDALSRAQGEVTSEDAARRYGEQRDLFARAFSDGIRAALSGDGVQFLVSTASSVADEIFRRQGEALFDMLFGPADLGKAAAEGQAQGAAAGAAMGTSITTSGATAAASMGQAIVAAGTAAAQAMASAIAAAGAGGGGKGGIAKLALSAFSGGKLPGKEFGGRVVPGQPTLVGEKRPEIFVPGQSGHILPRIPEPGPAGAAMSADKIGAIASAAAEKAVAKARPVNVPITVVGASDANSFLENGPRIQRQQKRAIQQGMKG